MPFVRERHPELQASLDDYERAFQWLCFSIACGHAPSGGHEPLQRLYVQHANSMRPDGELYPLVSAHWECVIAAYDLAAARNPGWRVAAQQRLRDGKAQHREAVGQLRQAWAR